MRDHHGLIRRYLDAMQAGDIAMVEELSTPDATLEYPGARRFASPAALFAWSTGRHSWVRHDFQHVDPAAGGDDDDIVYVSGTLAGAWMSGKAFDGIRFIYRFVVRDGRVHETRLWSDVAEVLRSGA